MKHRIGTVILIAVMSVAAIPQGPAANAIALAETGNYTSAIAELRTLAANDPKTFTANNYDYLLARYAESDGQLGLAMANYQNVAARDSLLTVYALKHLSEIARSTGNLMLERLYLQQLVLLSPDSLLVGPARQRIARNNFESGNYSETIRILNAGYGVTSSPSKKNSTNLREDQALLAEANLRSGKADVAGEIFNNLLSTMPNAAQPDDVAQTAAKGLDLLNGGAEALGKKAPDLAETEHLRRANIYQFNRDFADAKLHFEAIVARFPNGANAQDSLIQIGRGFTQQGDYVEALKWFERVQEQYPDTVAAKDALLLSAPAYARVGKHKEALKRYQKFIEKYPTDEKLERAYLNIVDVHRDQGEDLEAIKWCGKTREVFKGKLPETIATFAEARIHLARGDWPAALANLERLMTVADLGGTTPGGTTLAEVTFLKAYALEQMKRYGEAVDTYLSIHDGRAEYYGWRATERLREMAKEETAGSFITQKIGQLTVGLKAKDADARRKHAVSILRLTDKPDIRNNALGVLKAALKTLPKYSGAPDIKPPEKKSEDQTTVAGALLSLGLYDEATPELEAAGRSTSANTLATYYARGDRGDRALAVVEPLWRKMPADHPVELIPRDQLLLLYPAVYDTELRNAAETYNVDPRLILAIIHLESRFQPDVKSYAAARGLMQFISTTSTKVAGELGRTNFRQDELYYPPTAIKLGSRYLSDLFTLFPQQPDAVAASYNGGEDNMKRWLSRSRSNQPERYVPEIMFAQSKEYVYRVMTNYRMYQLIYDEQLKPR
ncbi:MAG: transglycosylase SLT domain-containing protein [Pyrinomonadaceae bacterium]